MYEVFTEAARLIAEGRRGALATIIRVTGSSPGKESAKLLVRDDGSTVGTVGGGCTESDIWRTAMEVLATEQPVRSRFRLTAATAAETGLLCGGEFEVYIEPIGNPTVVIFGAGHIAQALVPLLATLEYRTTVIDDRETFAHRDRFPLASDVQVRDLHDCLEGVPTGPTSCLVIVTRGHQHDETVLEQALGTSAGYIGLIGSKGKIGAIYKNLEKKGISRDRLDAVHAPIGLPLGSKSPEEIAISIAAELIAHRRGRSLVAAGSPGKQASADASPSEASASTASDPGSRSPS